jgi:hypothetical protein
MERNVPPNEPCPRTPYCNSGTVLQSEMGVPSFLSQELHFPIQSSSSIVFTVYTNMYVEECSFNPSLNRVVCANFGSMTKRNEEGKIRAYVRRTYGDEGMTHPLRSSSMKTIIISQFSVFRQ